MHIVPLKCNTVLTGLFVVQVMTLIKILIIFTACSIHLKVQFSKFSL